MQDVLERLVDVAAQVLRADNASVMVWDERRERLVLGAQRGFAPELADFVFAFHDGDEIGPRMPARIARQTGLTRTNPKRR